MAQKKTLTKEQMNELLHTVKVRFEKNMHRHKGMDWTKVQAGLETDAAKLWSLHEMESSGGEPDVIGQDSILFDDVKSKVYAIQNAAFATVIGFNAGVEIGFPYGFRLSSRYNYQLGEEEMDDGNVSRSRHAAPTFGITRLMYQQDKLSLEFNAMYSAEVSNENLNPEEQGKPFIYARDADGNPYSPAWHTVNFKAMYAFHKNFSVSAGVENITDQRYRSYSSGLVAPGRNGILSLSVQF